MLQIETQNMVGTVLLRAIVVDFRGWKSHITHVSIFWWCQTNGIWAFTQCALNMQFFHIFGGVLFILSLCMGGVLIDHVFSGYTVATSTQTLIIYPFIGVSSATICCLEGSLNVVFRWKRRWWRLKVVSHGHEIFNNDDKTYDDCRFNYLCTSAVCGL